MIYNDKIPDTLIPMSVTDWDTGEKSILYIDVSEEAKEELARWERKHGGCIANIKEIK